MPIEYTPNSFYSPARHTRRALINLVRSYENQMNEVLSAYGSSEVAFYLGDKVQPHSPSICFLAAADNWTWLTTAGPVGGPQKDLTVSVNIIPQIRITDPEAQEDAIQDFVAVIISILEQNLEFLVEVKDDIQNNSSPLVWKVWDSLILNGLNVPYHFRFGKTYRAAQITWQGKIDYLSPAIGSIKTYSSTLSDSDFN